MSIDKILKEFREKYDWLATDNKMPETFESIMHDVASVASQAEARGRESVVAELSITIDKWQNNNNRTDEFECGGYDALLEVKRLLIKNMENKKWD